MFIPASWRTRGLGRGRSKGNQERRRTCRPSVEYLEDRNCPSNLFDPIPGNGLTDHMAWYSEESQIQLQKTAAQEVVAVCTGGLPQSMANPEVLHKLGRFAEWKPSEVARWQIKRMEKLRR